MLGVEQMDMQNRRQRVNTNLLQLASMLLNLVARGVERALPGSAPMPHSLSTGTPPYDGGPMECTLLSPAYAGHALMALPICHHRGRIGYSIEGSHTDTITTIPAPTKKLHNTHSSIRFGPFSFSTRFSLIQRRCPYGCSPYCSKYSLFTSQRGIFF